MISIKRPAQQIGNEMKKIILNVCLLSLFLIAEKSFAQDHLLFIELVNQKPFTNVLATKLMNDTLTCWGNGTEFTFPIDSIKIIIEQKEGDAGVGFLIGSAIGGFLGSRYVEQKKENSSPLQINLISKEICIISGILLGGLIGGFVGMDHSQSYRFTNMDHHERVLILNKIIERTKLTN